ncbi:heparinase II/III family protein [Mariniphaga sp.]|uniref:heparinase II/III domain-containing protein n=1 Tax=Mariniphaga sp. TaxID=1954475 RepID=UPI00356A832F
MTKLDKKTGKPRLEPKSGFNQEEQLFIFQSYLNQKEIQLHFNVGSLGFLPANDEGHVDALAIALSIGENPFLINPGQEFYQKENSWKKYFTGTLANNTIRVNLKDQAEWIKPFTWMNQFKTTILGKKADNKVVKVKAQHDGYKNLGVNHLREIIFEKSKNLIWINDTIECRKSGFNFIEIPFHFHPKTFVKQNNSINYQVSDENDNLLNLIIDKKLKTQMVKGQIIPQILGWHSESLDKKEPCTTIYCTALIEQTITFQSILLIK